MAADPLLRFRPEFPILEKTTYLISSDRGLSCVDFENALEVSRELNARDVIVDYRPGAGIRMSPHFYTADEELDRAFDTIDEIRRSRAWERWRDRPAIVT